MDDRCQVKMSDVEGIQEGELGYVKPRGDAYDSDWTIFLYSSTRFIEVGQVDLRRSQSDKAWANFLSLGHDKYDKQHLEVPKESPYDRVGEWYCKGLLLPNQGCSLPRCSQKLRRVGVGRQLGITTVGLLVLFSGDAWEADTFCDIGSANSSLLLQKQRQVIFIAWNSS